VLLLPLVLPPPPLLVLPPELAPLLPEPPPSAPPLEVPPSPPTAWPFVDAELQAVPATVPARASARHAGA
jgi:hypothetical protein